MAESKPDPLSSSLSDKDATTPNVFERAKEEIDAILHTEKHTHHRPKETHGLRDDIDEDTSIDDVRAPNVFERVKEEIEALVQAIQSKNESKNHASFSNMGRSDATIKAEKPDSQPESFYEVRIWMHPYEK